MDKFDKIIKNNLEGTKAPEKYNKMIEDTMKMIENNEVKREETTNKRKSKKPILFKILQPVAAIFVMGILSVTVYATVTRKIKYSKYGI